MRKRAGDALSPVGFFLIMFGVAALGLALTSFGRFALSGALDLTVGTALVAGAWLFVGALTALFAAGRVAGEPRPAYEEYATAARHVAEGDFEVAVTRPFDPDAAEFADAFNRMTASLRERDDTLTSRVLELSMLFEMSRKLGSTLEMSALAEAVLDPTLSVLDANSGFIAIHDEDEHELDTVAERGAGRSTAPEDVAMAEWVYREGRPLLSNADTGARAVAGETVASQLIVPLKSNEGTIGVLAVADATGVKRFGSEDVRLLSTIANQTAIAAGNIRLFSTLEEAYFATVRSLAEAVDAKDAYTRGHSDRVASYATVVAEQLGLGEDQRTALEMAAYLHDIGKIGIPESILSKQGPLDAEERTDMNRHPLIGANIVSPVGFPWPITPIVRHHHERFDGAGYPAGLKGEQIPLLARILSIADSYEAITSDRPYRRGLSREAAVAELRRCAGTQFDPNLVDVFVALVERLGEPGAHGAQPLQAVELAAATQPARVPPHASAGDVRATFAMIVEGVLSGFSRTAGPRLAAQAELGLDSYLIAERVPARIGNGQVRFTAAAPEDPGGELAAFRGVLSRMNSEISALSGEPLLTQLYADVLAEMPAVLAERANRVGLLVEA